MKTTSTATARSGADWLRQLKDRDPKRRGEAAYVLGSVTPKDHRMLADLMDGLASRDKEVRFWAMTAIGRLKRKGAPAVPLLIKMLNDPAPANRQSAAEALADIGPAAAARSIPHIAKVLHGDRQPFVRSEAAQALGELGQSPGTARAATNALLKALGDRNADVRDNAAIALKLIGKHAPFAADAVAKAMDDPKLADQRDQLEIALRFMRRGVAKAK